MNNDARGARRWQAGALGALVLCASAAFAAPAGRLLTPVVGETQAQPALELHSAATPIRLNAAKALATRPGETFEVTLPNAMRHDYVLDMLQRHGDGMYSWVGHHRDRGANYRAVFTSGPGGSFGVIDTPQGQYRIIPGNGHDWLVDMSAERPFLPEVDLEDDMHVPPARAKRAPGTGTGVPTYRTAIPGVNVPLDFKPSAAGTTVDIMFLYTRGLALRLGGTLMTRLNFLVTRANTAYADSGIDMELRLVNAMLVDYPDTGDNGVTLNAVSPTRPGFDGAAFGTVEAVRGAFGADVVALLRNGSSFGGSGVAWVNGTDAGDAAFMYSVTTGCVLGCESVFIHEVGHNLGSSHDRATKAWQDGGTSSYSGVAGSAFGYVYCESGLLSCNPELPPASGGCPANQQPECSTGNGSGGTGTNNFGDLMAYFQGSSLRNYKFASPNVTCVGNTGIALPCGTAQSNAAATLSDHRIGVSAMKTSVVPAAPPGYIQFTDANFGTLEPNGNVAFSVSRLGGTAGTVSVSYATGNGTAKAGADFTAQSGTLTWGPGDASVKTVNVPVSNDGANEANGEFFTMSLSTPTGNVGTFIGYPSTAYGVIVDSWPLGGTMPGGFTTAGATAWTVDSSAPAYEGPFTLRSAQALTGDNSLSTTVNSDVTYTGTFVEGPVAFAYKVSSYQNLGVFEFRVDGVVAVSDTGESGWKYFYYPLTAGTHTLTWRFKNKMPSACNGLWSPAAVGGSSCADRAWIDAVVLPVSSTSSVLSDVNGDGKSDVVYRNNTTGQVFRLLANGTALSGGTMAYTEPNTAWKVIADGDFNGDGVSDLLWRNATTGQVFMMPFTSSGLPAAGSIIYTEPNPAWKIIQTPDLNGDGKADLLWWNSSTGQVYAMLLNGASVIGQGMVYTEPNLAWKIVAVGDLSGTGKKNQILYRNESSGLVYMMTVTYTGSAFTQVGQVIYSEPNTAWTIIGAPDLNGDGKSDLLYRNTATGQVYGILMNGGAVAGSGQLHVEPNTAWKVVSFGDYNGDGRADLLWRNDATGQLYMMLTAAGGLGIASQGMVYTEPNTAWKVLGPWEYAQ